MLKAIIIDDEIAALRSLELLLLTYCPNVSLVAKGQSVKEGVELVKRFNPDIVFLDIEMPQANGFELLEQLPALDFEVVFITAYNQYAIKAFKYSAIDYILKPIDIDELVKAIEKISDLRKSKLSPRERYAALFQNIEEILPQKLVIPNPAGFKYIDLNNVLLLKTEANLYFFTMVDGSVIECPRGTLEVDKTLEMKGFITLNNGVLVNLSKVERVDKRGEGKVFLMGNINISLEGENKERFMENLIEFSNKKKLANN